MRITRRELALAVAGGAAAASTVAVTPALAQNPQAAPDWDSAAREARLQSAQALLKVEVPMDVEPAFQFRA
jgi:ABC-type Fe3+ transport system permease subunit